jgi:HK97 family phage prohead protease
MLKLVTAPTFKLLAAERSRAGLVRRETVPVVAIVKATIEAVEPVDDRTLRFVISTGAVDRDQDQINQAGWALTHYQRNPVVLWAHQADEAPIGKAVEVALRDDRLTAAVQFLPPDTYGAASARADAIYRLALDGYLSASSVGFRPIKWDFTDDKDRGAENWWPGIDFHEQELVEFSIVAVPANPEALIEQPSSAVPAPSVAVSAAQVAATGRERRRRAATVAEIVSRAMAGLQPRGSFRT